LTAAASTISALTATTSASPITTATIGHTELAEHKGYQINKVRKVSTKTVSGRAVAKLMCIELI
jgi:hypothetical protein